jgi:hypothetical protein
MKRRNFGLLGGCGLAAMTIGLGMPRNARAGVSAAQAAALKSGTLTPMGSDPTASADGSIPAWTGGYTEIPAGWVSPNPMPDMFASDAILFTIDSSNVAQYQAKLAVGIVQLIQQSGFSVDVYKTRRTACAPQWVYDNIYQNALNAVPNPAGIRLGFTGATGGVPFPIPDQSDPYLAGGQIVWNHLCRWNAQHSITPQCGLSMIGGVLTNVSRAWVYLRYPYYNNNGSATGPESGIEMDTSITYYGPPDLKGFKILEYEPTNPVIQNTQAWELLTGQGRVRKAPELTYDVPETEIDDINNYDEIYMFMGAPDRYDWKLIGKTEIYIPYNCNRITTLMPEDFQPKFLNPAKLRWELHRVWVVEGTVHPGERNVTARRRFYVDEDNWTISLADEWDAQGNLWKNMQYFPLTRPDVPGTTLGGTMCYNFQQGDYDCNTVDIGLPLEQRTIDYVTVPSPSLFSPEDLAASAAY